MDPGRGSFDASLRLFDASAGITFRYPQYPVLCVKNLMQTASSQSHTARKQILEKPGYVKIGKKNL